jgi:hypothetical protein
MTLRDKALGQELGFRVQGLGAPPKGMTLRDKALGRAEEAGVTDRGLLWVAVLGGAVAVWTAGASSHM